MNNGKMIAGFALGALAGAALSCFAHSHKGHQLRKDIQKALHDMYAKGCCCKSFECDEKCECTDDCACQKADEQKV